MNANEAIESYVNDVAVLLPRRQRNDVAFELRALLAEGLQDKAEDAGREADEAMAVEFLNAFGRPTEVAARYRPTLTIIDPEDGHRFLRNTTIGLAILWAAGLIKLMQQPMESGAELLGALGQWWVSMLVYSMWWPGLMVLSYATAAWVRRRWPQTSPWRPRDEDRIVGSRATLVLGVVGIICGVSLLMEPRWVLDFFWDGKAAPAAYQALTYTEAFRHRQGPLLFGLLALYVPLMIAVIISGRWSSTTKRLELVLGLAGVAMQIWVILDGPVFMAQSSDQAMKFGMAVMVVITLAHFGIKRYRRIRPSPNPATPT